MTPFSVHGRFSSKPWGWHLPLHPDFLLGKRSGPSFLRKYPIPTPLSRDPSCMSRVAWHSFYQSCSKYTITEVFTYPKYPPPPLKSLSAQKRKLLAAAAAAGVSVAFGSPLGGVLFGLEELDTFSFSDESDVMWRGFVTSSVAAVTLQYVDPFGTSKLVLFQVTGVTDTWRAFELVRSITSSCCPCVLTGPFRYRGFSYRYLGLVTVLFFRERIF